MISIETIHRPDRAGRYRTSMADVMVDLPGVLICRERAADAAGSPHGRFAAMISHAERPIVFLDVDGPLIPFRARPAWRRDPVSDLAAPLHHASGNPLVDRLDPADGRRLVGLGCQLIWATTWRAEANEIVAPRLGLPELLVVEFPDTDDEPVHGLHWKTPALVAWAAGRPFVWIDDEATDIDRRWVANQHPGRALVHRVDPFIGLTDADFSSIRRWLTAQPTA